MGLGSFAGGMARAGRHEAAKMGTGHAMQSTPAEGPFSLQYKPRKGLIPHQAN